MERTTFLQYIQQKNDSCDSRKLSFQNFSSLLNDKNQKGIFHVESPAFHSQLPAFINRKVKNLKPYTNHFKRFNIQTEKIPDIKHPNNHANKQRGNNYQSQKDKMAKSNLLKQLGIRQQIKPSQTGLKIPQISVYEQFLQKTSTIITTNVIDSMYQNCIKKSAKLQKQTYQRSQRLQHRDSDEKFKVPKQQRQSLGVSLNQGNQQFFCDRNSKKSIKSMNQLPKTEQGLLKSEKVCVVPNLINLQHEEIFCSSNRKSFVSIKKKYSAPLKECNKKQLWIFNENQRKKLQNLGQKDQLRKKISEQVLIQIPKSLQTLQKQQETKRQLISSNRKRTNNQFQTQSPQKQAQRKNIFNFNIGLNSKKKGPKAPLTKSNKEETTINVDKSKNKVSTPKVPVPSTLTAFSYIVYEPSFSKNSKFRFTEQNLKNTNKVFENSRVLASLNCKSVVQIASLTKIMTFLLVLQICQKLQIDSTCEEVRIGKYEASINGTSAEIQQGEVYTVEQLYYGLMLPSGNDASLSLAIWGGKKMLIHELKEKQRQKRTSTQSNFLFKISSERQKNQGILNYNNKKIVLKKKKCYERFISEMNKRARCLGMNKTNYANSHGLSNNLNKSCAFDLCILCEYAMMNDKFKKVVSTINYKSKIRYQLISVEQKKPSHHIKMQEYESNTFKTPLDDIEHQNEHSDQESTQSIDEKQYFASAYLFTDRQKLFRLSQTNSSYTKQTDTKPLIMYGQREVCWQNTHKLLAKQEYIGIKTGITNTAGSCLASCIKTKQNRHFIIIVLNSKKLQYRFKDTETLRKWIYKKQNLAQKPLSKFSNQEQNLKQQQGQNSPVRDNNLVYNDDQQKFDQQD